MNHYTAFQPPHLDGQWQYVMLGRSGGGPICGCELEVGHATRDEAERHYYETSLDQAYAHAWDDDECQRQCEVCEAWTANRVIVRVGQLHDLVHVLCPSHAVGLGNGDVKAQRGAVARLVPFRPGAESWGSM